MNEIIYSCSFMSISNSDIFVAKALCCCLNSWKPDMICSFVLLMEFAILINRKENLISQNEDLNWKIWRITIEETLYQRIQKVYHCNILSYISNIESNELSNIRKVVDFVLSICILQSLFKYGGKCWIFTKSGKQFSVKSFRILVMVLESKTTRVSRYEQLQIYRIFCHMFKISFS